MRRVNYVAFGVIGLGLVVGTGAAAAMNLLGDSPDKAVQELLTTSTVTGAGELSPGTSTPEPAPALSQTELQERAIQVISDRHGVPPGSVVIGHTARATFEITNRHANAFKLYNQETGENFQLYLDDAGQELDSEQLFRDEMAAGDAKFGKLTPQLHEKLAGSSPGERFAVQVMPVTDHSSPVDGEPEVGSPGAPGSANPLPDEEFKRLAEVRDRQALAINTAATEPIVVRLEAMGLRVESNPSIAWISVGLSAAEIAIVAEWPDVLAIGSADSSEPTPAARAD